MCNCFEGGTYFLDQTSRGEIYLNLEDKQIELDDVYTGKSVCLLTIKYCPMCGEKLE